MIPDVEAIQEQQGIRKSLTTFVPYLKLTAYWLAKYGLSSPRVDIKTKNPNRFQFRQQVYLFALDYVRIELRIQDQMSSIKEF